MLSLSATTITKHKGIVDNDLGKINNVLKLIRKVDGNSRMSPLSDFSRMLVVKHHVLEGKSMNTQLLMDVEQVRIKYVRRAKGLV